MKKILFLCDGDNYPKGAFQFIKNLNTYDPVFVKGIFFTPIDYEQLVSVSYIPVTEPYAKMKYEELKMVDTSRELFRKQCTEGSIKFLIHEKSEEWNKELLIKESRYADLIVISEELFCSQLYDSQPNFFMQELLRESECPVMIIPEEFHEPERIIFACDGKKESVYALKQFTYLFPKYTDLPSEFVYMNEEAEEFPDQELLQEYTRWHINSLGSSKLAFNPKKFFSTWLEYKKNAMVITGSYSRSGISNLFKSSFSDKVIREHYCPVFVAHV